MNRDFLNKSQSMIESKLFDIVGGIIIDLVKDQIKQHKLLNTSFLRLLIWLLNSYIQIKKNEKKNGIE